MARCRYESPLDKWRCAEEATTEDGLCIFHDPDLRKDVNTLKARFEARLADENEDFLRLDGSLFPEGISFERIIFTRSISFYEAQFHGEQASFRGAQFRGQDTFFTEAQFHGQWTYFGGAQFHGQHTFFTEAQFHGQNTNFKEAQFHGQYTLFSETQFRSQYTFFTEAQFHGQWTYFGGAQFHGQQTYFGGAQFNSQQTNFKEAQFRSQQTLFSGAQFRSQQTLFEGTFFKDGGRVNFGRSSLGGRTIFVGVREADQVVPIFSGVEVYFTQVVIDPLDAVSFRDADFQKCRLLDTDVRKVEMTGVKWSEIGSRFGVYDEKASERQADRPWDRIERLYRELKQNYEDRRDYERAGDFHYGEKEMLRRNPATSPYMKALLNLYCWVSGYGERFLRPLIFAGVLFLLSTAGYLFWGLSRDGGGPTLELTNAWDWARAADYSFRVMTFLRPADYIPHGFAKAVNTLQTLLGPLFFGLFALAVRQRLRR